jgi:hypothetical protein
VAIADMDAEAAESVTADIQGEGRVKPVKE